MRGLIVLLLSLPWWGSALVFAALAGLFYLSLWYFRRRFDQIVHEAVRDAGAALKDAEAVVHSVTAVPMPGERSPYDIQADDEEFMEGVDDEPWDDDGVSYYAIEVTITPALEGTRWDPTGLTLVPADYVPEDETDISEQMCPLHSAEIFVNGRFQSAREQDVAGPQRLKMIFAVHDGLRAVKFALFVTYFGHVDLPAPLPKGQKAATRQ